MSCPWFHRNCLKATSPLKLENVQRLTRSKDVSELLKKMKIDRQQLLKLLSNAQSDVTAVQDTSRAYISAYLGFVFKATKPGEDSPLRKLVPIHWTQTLTGKATVGSSDGVFELASMLINIAIWYMKHGSSLADSGSLTMDEAKDIHKSFRTAAGMFQLVKDKFMTSLGTLDGACNDTDQHILEAYYLQCIAETEEVTIARAIELKHKSKIVAGLCNEASIHFQDTAKYLSSCNAKYVGKWQKYLTMKSAFYMACAYGYYCEMLLKSDKCGDAIKFGQEALKFYNSVENAAKDYIRCKGEGRAAKITDHPFYRKVGSIIKQNLDKATRENGFIYHQKIPKELPQFSLQASYGLAKPEDVEMPEPSSVWTAEIYAAFDVHDYATEDAKNSVKDVKELPPVVEVENKSGESSCIIQ